MKVAIPVEEKTMTGKVCPSFGRAPYFLIYDQDTKEASFVDNSAADSAGGAGIKAAQMIVDNKADVLLTPRCGENAAGVLQAAGVKMYKTMDESVADNIKAWSEGKLSSLTEIHPGLHHHGGK